MENSLIYACLFSSCSVAATHETLTSSLRIVRVEKHSQGCLIEMGPTSYIDGQKSGP